MTTMLQRRHRRLPRTRRILATCSPTIPRLLSDESGLYLDLDLDLDQVPRIEDQGPRTKDLLRRAIKSIALRPQNRKQANQPFLIFRSWMAQPTGYRRASTTKISVLTRAFP